MQHYLTYQHNVQQFFRKHADKYQGIMIPLSIATSFSDATNGFVRALCTRHNELEYAIDPRDPIFQKQWDRKSVRPPHEKMAASLGGPFLEFGLERNLVPNDFNETAITDCTRNCIEFQKLFRSNSENERKQKKYNRLLGISESDSLKEPQHLIPPYFQFSQIEDPWYKVSLSCIEAALALRESIPIRPVFHFADWIEASDWKPCISRLAESGIDQMWLYPNDFKERDASFLQLQRYRSTVEAFVTAGLNPYELFGGYFSVLMSYFGLRGFANGVGYGEWRESGYHKGGSAQTRIYILRLHRYIDSAAAQSLIDQDPEYFGIGSDIIDSYVEAGESVVDMTLEHSLNHFMECRMRELDFVGTRDVVEAKAELDETRSRLRPLELDKYGASLQNWGKAIS